MTSSIRMKTENKLCELSFTFNLEEIYGILQYWQGESHILCWCDQYKGM